MRVSPEDYRDKCWDKVEEYIDGVSNGDIITGIYIKKVVQRFKTMVNQPDKYVYNIKKVDKAFMFFSFLNIEHKNQYLQIDLMPWQSFIIAFIFGFYRKDDVDKRVIREVLIFCARKNGKTAFAASLQLYAMLADGVINPQSLLLANTTQQATVALNFAKNMVVHTPQLNDRLLPQRSRIIFKDINKQGFCQIFSPVDAARLEGHSPSFAILDEAHGYEDKSIYQAVKTGTGARVNPLIMITTTAGNKTNGFLNDYLDYHKSILDGNIEDDSTIAFIYQIDTTDDRDDTSVWIKANPSLGVINSLDDLKVFYNTAKHSSADEYAFVTKHLNIFWDTPLVWIPEDKIIPLFEDFDEQKLYGRDAYIGMDLSRNTDLASVTLLVPIPEENMTYVIPYFYIANRPENLLRRTGKNLASLVQMGKIKMCDNEVIDLELIANDIIDLSKNFNIVDIAYDPYNSPQLVAKLKEEGLNCTKFSQTAMKFNAPLKTLETMIYSKTIKFKNDVLVWHFANVVLYVDQNANIKIVKNKQMDSVDGVVSLGMAIGAYLSATYGDEIMGLNAYLDSMKEM